VTITLLQSAQKAAELAESAALTNTTTASDWQTTSSQISGDKPSKG